jgi:uncharacterized protein (DUF3084 family)
MDGLSTPTELVPGFRTPVRILVPKLIKGRANWKDKCQQRRRQNKTLQIKIRDLSASRDGWRAKYEALLAEHQQLQIERDQLRTQREIAAPDEQKKT